MVGRGQVKSKEKGKEVKKMKLRLERKKEEKCGKNEMIAQIAKEMNERTVSNGKKENKARETRKVKEK